MERNRRYNIVCKQYLLVLEILDPAPAIWVAYCKEAQLAKTPKLLPQEVYKLNAEVLEKLTFQEKKQIKEMVNVFITLEIDYGRTK